MTFSDRTSSGEILIVDDNVGVLHLLKHALKRLNCKLTLSANGQEALALLETGRFQVALLDLMLPALNGLEILDRIQGQQLPTAVIVLTAQNLPETVAKAKQLGAYDYVIKPFQPQALRALVSRAMEQQRPTAEQVAAQSGTSTPTSAAEPSAGIDFRAALQAVGGDREILHQAFRLFLEQDYPGQLKALERGLERHRTQQVEAAAHGLKGALKSFGGQAASDTAWRLEELAQNKNFGEAQRMLETFKAKVQGLAAFYREEAQK